MANTELGQDRVDRAYLHAPAPGAIANLRGFKVVVTVGCDERKSSEPGDDRFLRARPLESLQDLLIDEPRRNNEFAVRQCSFQGAHLDDVGRWVAAKRPRPDACVHEEAQSRERSCL